ncbi:hypothetical protein HPHPH6_1467 [Helicobacter pylori Hp H-6]|uniref:Uncharacterized protein n=1 Tax=Helicobacter pylori Hp H-6 TaxID=992061 RepID=I9UJ71_HELPX|nr:hypothetical protein HPHPH6_1467 [Helicobacter pylori Hp H-6]
MYSPFFTKKEQGLKNFQLYLAFACFWIKFSFFEILKPKTKTPFSIFQGLMIF